MDDLDLLITRGFKLFPIEKNGKKPLGKWTEISKTRLEIEELLLNGYNYGAVIPKDVIIIDVDRHGNKDGFTTLMKYSHAFNETYKVQTPHDGLHLYYRVPAGKYKRTVPLYEGIDLLYNGYIIGPGSSINQKEYKPLNNNDIAIANDAVLEFIKGAEISKDEQPQLSDQVVNTTDQKLSEGNRNDYLFKLACRLHKAGLSQETALKSVYEENLKLCTEPLPADEIKQLVKSAFGYQVETQKELDVNSEVITLENVEPKEMQWLVQDLIPLNEVTTIGADGGTGKSFFWMSLFASLSAGHSLFFSDEEIEPKKVMFFASEDDLETVIVNRLRRMNANMRNIITLPNSSRLFNAITFDSPYLEDILRRFKPDVVVFDPIQAFIGADVNMGSQNQMRHKLQNLKRLAHDYEATFLIISHTNKRNAFSARDKLANSGDVWDFSRAVIMMGKTPDHEIFLSLEKGNYSPERKTVIFNIIDGKLVFSRYDDKTYYDFQVAKANGDYTAEPEKKESKGDTARRLIMKFLSESPLKEKLSNVLKEEVKDCGVSEVTYNRVRSKLVLDNKIKNVKRTENGKINNYTALVENEGEAMDFEATLS